MEYLDSFDLRRLVAGALPMPAMPICSPWIEQITCPICLSLKLGAMVIHRDCMRLFCAQCALACYDTNRVTCGFCRGDLIHYARTDGKLRFCSPPPNDVWLLDNTKFSCKDCNGEFTYERAKTHPNNCNKNPNTFKPPEYIHDWNNVEAVSQQTVSNPMTGESETRRDRLLIYHHNGQQLDSKFANANWEVARVKQQIGRLTDTDALDIRLFKFYHEELQNDSLVRDIAPKQGATHITSFTTSQKIEDLAQSTVFISFNDKGPHPIKARPPSNRVRGRTQV